MAVDEAATALEGSGFVSVGGDLAVRGPVDVALPAGGAIRVVAGGLATSGTASRGDHLVDTETASPASLRGRRYRIGHVPRCRRRGQAGFLLGYGGPEWLAVRGIPGRFVARDGESVENRAWDAATRVAQPCT